MDAAGKRMLWRCRRGLLELDIVLQRFVEAHYAQLTPAQALALDELLNYADNDLWDLVTARIQTQYASQQEVLDMMQALKTEIKTVN